MQGKRVFPHGLTYTPRLVPTCAGKTAHSSTTKAISSAHPRVCGENVISSLKLTVWLGSSPRVRGKLWDLVAVFVNAGLIPACAGKTFPAMSRVRYIRAHPRVCGENTNDTISAALEGGSSPRVRGKHAPAETRSAGERLIPACAGKTPVTLNVTSAAGAHPRVCGENEGSAVVNFQARGSSPRVRGKPFHLCVQTFCDGLIPAWAGKT